LTTEFKDAGTEVQLHGWTDDSVPDDVEHIVKVSHTQLFLLHYSS
jgi:hypothetical protein